MNRQVKTSKIAFSGPHDYHRYDLIIIMAKKYLVLDQNMTSVTIRPWRFRDTVAVKLKQIANFLQK